jgi:hypothetical protein
VQSEYGQIQPVYPAVCVQLRRKSWLHHPPKGCQKLCFCWCIVFSTFTYIEWCLDQMNRIIVFIINFSEQMYSFRVDITMNSSTTFSQSSPCFYFLSFYNRQVSSGRLQCFLMTWHFHGCVYFCIFSVFN